MPERRRNRPAGRLDARAARTAPDRGRRALHVPPRLTYRPVMRRPHRGATVMARVDGRTLRVEVRDDGVGGALTHGSGLIGLRDSDGAQRHVQRGQPAGPRNPRDGDDPGGRG